VSGAAAVHRPSRWRALAAAAAAAGAVGCAADAASRPTTPPTPVHAAVAPARNRLLVVAPAAFASALADFCRERARQRAAPVDFLALEDVPVDPATPGCDLPERLKRELHRRWRDAGLAAVLLVGDADVMPVRFMMLDRVSTSAFDTAFYASDLYYADLAHGDGAFDDWNAAKTGVDGAYFGQVHGERHKDGPINRDGVSYAPEIACGRWPVSTPAQAREVADKTLRHQAAVATAAARAGAPPAAAAQLRFFFSGGWIDNRDRAEALRARLRADGAWSHEAHAWYLHGREPSLPAVATALADGAVALFHTGHGQPWSWEGCLDGAVLAAAPATDAPPLLFSIGCSTAVVCAQPPYDGYRDVDGIDHAGTNAGEVFAAPPPPPACLQPGSFNATSMAEAAVRRRDGGAIAAIGCVTGSQPCAHTLLDGFVAAMSSAPTAAVGDWWTAALREYVRAERLMELTPTASWYPPSVFFQAMKFVCLGDPTVRLR
jgi:hypothetical protein